MLVPKRILISSHEIPLFFESLKLRYLLRTRVDSDRFLEYNWANSSYYAVNEKEFTELTARYGADLSRARRSRLNLGWVSETVGWGVFAELPMAEGSLVGEYTGVIRQALDAPPERDEEGHFLSDFSWNYPDELPDGTEFEIDARREGNELRFVNHSFSPNCAVDHTLVDGVFVTFFRTIAPIRAGEQLFVDYGEEYWSGGFRQMELL